MKTLYVLLAGVALNLVLPRAAQAADFYPWRDHAAPFSFRFGNDIDTHQQTRVTRDHRLFGFFYVHFTGTTTRDRYPVASHADCNAVPDCTVGWTLGGRPQEATLLYHVPPDHPVFLIGRADIPQPGSPSHFHWLGEHPAPGETVDGYVLELTAVDRFCFIHHGAEQASPALNCRDNGGVNVDRGHDIATHLNLVTSRPPGF